MLVDHICTIQCTLIRILFIQLHMIDEKKHVHNLYTYYVKHIIGLLIQCNNCIFAYFLIINLNAYDKLGDGTEVENILKDIFVILCVKH